METEYLEKTYVYDYDAVYGFNDTFDYKNIPYIGEIKKLPLYEIVLKSYIYAMIIFFSLVGNTLIIVVVLRHKQMRTTTNYYIVNLAVADILVTVFCTWVHLVNNLNNNNWVLGGFFCKFNTFCQVFCLIASVLSLTLIAYDRFFGIVFALKAHMSNRKARFSIGIIWIASFAIASPLLRFRELKVRQWQDYTERWCDDDWPLEMKTDPATNFTYEYMPSRTIYFTFVSAVLYFFPMIVMTLVYSVIILKLRGSTMPGERVDSGYAAQQKTKRKVIAMLVTIMAVFGICWLPYQIVLLYSELRENRETLGEWFFTLQFLAGCFAYSNSALNPLIYAGFNKNFKQAILSLKTDIDSWQSRRISIQTCFHRPSLPNVDIRRGSRFSDPLLRGPYSAKSSFSDRTLPVHSKYTRMSIDSSPVTHLLREPRKINSSPISVRNEEEMRLEIKRSIFAWQKKEYSLIPRRSPQLSRSKTVNRRRASSDDADSIYRRHTIDSPRVQHIFQII